MLAAVVVLTALVTAAVTSAVVTAAVPGSRTVWSDAVVPPDLERPDNVAADHRKAVIELPTGPNRFWGARDVSGLAACPQGWACFFQHRDLNAERGWMALAQNGNLLSDFPRPTTRRPSRLPTG